MSDLHDLAAAYVIGALTPDEVDVFEAHLDTCDQCQEEIEQLGEGLAGMAQAMAEDPPSGLRERVLNSIEDANVVSPSAWRTRLGPVLLPAAAVLALIVGAVSIFGGGELSRVIGAQDAVSIELSVSDAYPSSAPELARVIFSPTRGKAVVEFEGLAEVSADRTYQLWLIGGDGPIPAGTFTTTTGGSVSVLVDGDASSGLVLGITEEPSGGSPAPTGDVLFSAEL